MEYAIIATVLVVASLIIVPVVLAKYGDLELEGVSKFALVDGI